MIKFALLFTVFVITISCEKYDNTCNCSNPLEDLLWLKELKSSLTNCDCGISIFQATYNSQTVFYTIMNDPLCDGYFIVNFLDCNGEIIKIYEPPFDETFTSEVTGRNELYYCKTEK